MVRSRWRIFADHPNVLQAAGNAKVGAVIHVVPGADAGTRELAARLRSQVTEASKVDPLLRGEPPPGMTEPPEPRQRPVAQRERPDEQEHGVDRGQFREKPGQVRFGRCVRAAGGLVLTHQDPHLR